MNAWNILADAFSVAYTLAVASVIAIAVCMLLVMARMRYFSVATQAATMSAEKPYRVGQVDVEYAGEQLHYFKGEYEYDDMPACVIGGTRENGSIWAIEHVAGHAWHAGVTFNTDVCSRCGLVAVREGKVA